MPKQRATVGQLLVNSMLPSDLVDYSRVLDKQGLAALLREVGTKHPDKYRDISYKLNRLGQKAAYVSGMNSFGLQHLRTAKAAAARRKRVREVMKRLLDDDNLTEDERRTRLIMLAANERDADRKEIYDESIAENNPLALQLKGAGRGNQMNLQSLRGSDWLYQDHKGNIIPIPVIKSYSQGLSPAEYWSGTYGARLGVLATKFATRDSGYMSKQLNQIAHRLVVTDLDGDKEPDTLIGLPTEVDDSDNEGALLALPAGGYARNTILTPKILSQLKRQGLKRILVRSPMASNNPHGGVYARDAGVREFGNLPARGSVIGMTAAQALSEPITQGALSTKHSGGVAGESKSLSAFDHLNSLIQVPKTFKGGAAHAESDGTVQAIADSPTGGKYVTINNKQHYVASGYDLLVKPGDKVEAGDIISEGIPNPAVITRHKGIGEGRRYFVKSFLDAFRNNGLRANRRNIELLASGLINHVRLTDEIGDFAPDDVVSYSTLASSYRPREDFESRKPSEAVGRYLERPYLHYSIGTKIRPSMLQDFTEFGIQSVDVHREPPPFEAEMIRGMANLQHDEDWQTRMFGSGLKGSLLESVHRGGTSDAAGTSFVPSRAKAVDFGSVGFTKTPNREENYPAG